MQNAREIPEYDRFDVYSDVNYKEYLNNSNNGFAIKFRGPSTVDTLL